jgi:hypothetical protein
MENNHKLEERKSTHLELPEYVWIPVDEDFMSPETVTNISQETLSECVNVRYATMDGINPDFYEKIRKVYT